MSNSRYLTIMKNKVFIFLWILFFYGCTDKETQQNFQDIHKINKKMHFQEAIKIMRNPPIKIWNNPSKNVFFYDYKNNTFGGSSDFSIIFSMRDSLVIEINYGD